MSLAINTAMTALRTLDKKMEVTANNTANVNTDGFKASRVETQEAYPAGVKVTISQTETPGTPLQDAEGSETSESSNVSLEEQMQELVMTSQMYRANLEVIKAEDETLGALLDIRG